MKHKGTFLVIIMLFSITRFCIGSGKNAEHKASIIIPNVALLSLQYENSSGVELCGISPSSAGNTIKLEADSEVSVWLNYSSICHKNQKRKVTATVEGKIPEGVVLKLKAEDSVGNGNGELGKTNGTVVLGQRPADVISGIGSCYTGKGAHNGHLLSYQVELDETRFHQNTKNKGASVNVVYTLTDDN
ncbi:hypothetical protein [Maribellus sp. YY47]|uniref:hypothetical protein n=1 Tax=Maribellus sp. YY47 TaxID=2929486 RepID=UPI002001B303|nr:hypothetical protein [Maribellus sp. YY47]MCK3685533.1 hypothetical protein [Maribellus sp. YY47]